MKINQTKIKSIKYQLYQNSLFPMTNHPNFLFSKKKKKQQQQQKDKNTNTQFFLSSRKNLVVNIKNIFIL